MPHPSVINLTDQKFSRLTVIERVENNKHRATRWKCQCKCGNIVFVDARSLRSGKTKSCGCLRKEILGDIATIHGMYYRPEYNIWINIIQRCENPKNKSFKNYGARGITICDEWRHDFVAFFNHVGQRPSSKHSIDRIDNNAGYKPKNVQWSLPQKQANNNRHNHNIILYGWKMSLANWARFTGITRGALGHRIRAGWSPAKAIFTPLKHRYKFPRTY